MRRESAPVHFLLSCNYGNGQKHNSLKGGEMNMAKKKVASKIQAARREKGLTGYELAKRTGLHPSNISKIEHRREVPGERAKAALLKELGLLEQDAFDKTNGLARKA